MSEPVPYRTDVDREAARSRLAAHLDGDGLIVYPTETVYGLGCALTPVALRRLAEFKGDRPFLLLVRGVEDAAGLDWTAAARRLAERFWPGPLTLALGGGEGRFPAAVVSGEGAVAVRVSPHPAVPWILEAAGGPVTSTSANRPGEPPARDAAAASAVVAGLDRVLVLDGGALPDARPSTIVRCGATIRLVREGAVSRGELESVVELE